MKKIAALVLLLAFPALAHAAFPHRGEEPSVRDMVIEEADAACLDRNLALAVAEVESDFNPYALSDAGARGVIQVMPATARGEFGVHPDALWDSRTNIRTGVAYLKRLIDTYDGRVDIALSHYNGGSAVRRGNELRVIPATRDYVEKVMDKAGIRRDDVVAWQSSRAGRMLHYENGDHYINDVSAWNDDAHLAVSDSGRIVNADGDKPWRTTGWKRDRHIHVAPSRYYGEYRDVPAVRDEYRVPAGGARIPVARIEARHEDDGWPSVAELRAAREWEGW